jgi:two-component sensor histidine kinase
MLSGLVRLKSGDLARQTAEPARDSMRLLLEGVGVQIDAVARLHRALALHGSAAPADLGVHLHEVSAPFVSGVFGPITLIEDFAPRCAVRPDQLLPLTQIFAEVLTNAVKHAPHAGEPQAILARCRPEGAGVVVEVIDHGPGFPAGFDPQTDGGLGFRLLRALGRQLGASIVFESSSRGVRFRLTTPPALV